MPPRSSQTPRAAAAVAKNEVVADTSSADDDELEGKLAEELDDEVGSISKNKKGKKTTATKTKAVTKPVKPAAAARKVQLPAKRQPSLPPSPSSDSEDEEASMVKAKEKEKQEQKDREKLEKSIKRSKLRPVPSFEEPLKKPTPKPAVKYRGRKSAAATSSSNDETTAGAESDGDADSVDEVPAPSSRKPAKAKPVVELAVTKSASPPNKEVKKQDTARKSKPRVVLTPPPSATLATTEEVAAKTPSPQQNEEEKEPEPTSTRGRAAKAKTLKRLADYNLDEVAATDAGSAGIVLDEIVSPAKKKARKDESSISSMDEPKKTVAAAVAVVVAEVTEQDPEAAEPEAPTSPTKDAPAPSSPVKSPKTVVTNTTKSASPAKAKVIAKPRTKAQPEPAPKRSKASPSSDSPDLVPDLPAIAYDKKLILKMIVAKLEATKNCDWYELSVQLGKEGLGGEIGGAKKGRKSQQKGKVTGDDLYELYHHVSYWVQLRSRPEHS